MSTPSEDPTLRNPKPVQKPEPAAPAPRTAPSEPKLAYSEVPDRPTPRTDRIARGAGRVTPPRRTATPPMAAPHRMAPRPHPTHGAQQHRPPAQQARAQQANQARPPQAQSRPARPAGPAQGAPSNPPAPQAQNPAPERARPRLTGPEWAAAAAMIVLVLAVLLGLALA
ncbi:hypothetical protein ACFWXB_00150 [Tsukamurella tyrosinosolvens]|uniref:hypothetical protein n=2 Tax=Tsukamurella tyrosinosolvens TaxID=57704 RepID=UPI0036B7756A